MSQDATSTLKGKCFCGRVQYEVQPPLKFVAHDHCSMCRRLHGAAFVTWSGVPETQFKVLTGQSELKSFASSAAATRQFCGHCGTQLFFRSTRWPGEVHFTYSSLYSSLEPAPERQPSAHVFYSDRVAWIEIKDSLKKLGGASGTEPLEA